MKKDIIVSAFALFMLMSVSACDKEVQDAPEVSDLVQRFTVVGPDPVLFESVNGSAQTKGTAVQDGNALVFNWAVGDTLGIFPNKGNQVEFPITEVQGSTSATFDGGGWALRNDASYAAYYPFSVWDYHKSNKTILMDYTGQVQNGNGGFAHLSAYDFLASDKATPQNNAVTLQMDRQGSILYIDIVMPQAGELSSLVVSCREAIFVEKAELDISGDTPQVSPTKMTDKLTLSFVNTSAASANETVRAYMAVQPVDFSEKNVTATITISNHNYWATVTPRAVDKGRAAFLRFSGGFNDESVIANPTASITDFEYDDTVTH